MLAFPIIPVILLLHQQIYKKHFRHRRHCRPIAIAAPIILLRWRQGHNRHCCRIGGAITTAVASGVSSLPPLSCCSHVGGAIATAVASGASAPLLSCCGRVGGVIATAAASEASSPPPPSRCSCVRGAIATAIVLGASSPPLLSHCHRRCRCLVAVASGTPSPLLLSHCGRHRRCCHIGGAIAAAAVPLPSPPPLSRCGRARGAITVILPLLSQLLLRRRGGWDWCCQS